MKVKISIEDNGRKADIEIDESDNLTKLVIIQNVFNLFGIDTDVLEMSSTFNKIGKAYSSFFNEVKPIEANRDAVETKSEQIRNEMTKGLTLEKDELESTYKATDDQPEHIRTGIRERDGKKLYRLHYKCPACWNKSSHWVYENSKKTWCHRCQHEMPVFTANPEGFPNRDSFGNFFRAGDFYDWNMFSESPLE